MTNDDLKTLLDGSDLGTALPDLNAFVEGLAPVMKIALLAGPVILLVLGLVYLLASPKEANYTMGYRCYFGMGSVHAWRYTQRLAGILFTVVGLILSLVMFSATGKFAGMEVMDMLWKTIRYGIIEAVVILLTILTINITVACFFDAKGRLRKKNPKRKQEEPEL